MSTNTVMSTEQPEAEQPQVEQRELPPFGSSLSLGLPPKEDTPVMFGSKEFLRINAEWNIKNPITWNTPREKLWILGEDKDGIYLWHYDTKERKPYIHDTE
jgi:hypothetical protein